MRFVSIDRVKRGSYLAKPIYSNLGTILVKEHVKLSEGILNRLKELGFVGLYIEDKISEGIEIKDVIDEQLRIEAIITLENIIKDNGNFTEMQPIIENIVDSIIEKKDVLLHMHQLQNHHDYTYSHCINVGILSISMGVKMKYTRGELINLGTSGILHDIGKNSIPKEILDKPGKLTKEEYDCIKKHPEHGYNMIKEILEIDGNTKAGVLQHHERCDGTGYPFGLKRDEISSFGKIIAVADTYDAMTTDRVYRPAFSPFEVYEYLMGDGNTKYEIDIIKKFGKCITIYPEGGLVELSDGTNAIVMKTNANNTLRPIVRNIDTNEIIDLMNDSAYRHLCIKKVV